LDLPGIFGALDREAMLVLTLCLNVIGEIGAAILVISSLSKYVCRS
jgi:hypothetical protein